MRRSPLSTLLTACSTPVLLIACGTPVLLTACATPVETELQEPAPPEPERPVEPEPVQETWELGDTLVIHTVDAEILSLMDPATDAILGRYQLDGRAGDQPVVVDNLVYVTLRDDRAMAVLEPVVIDGERTLVEAWRVEVGPEPRGLVVDAEVGRAWVAVSMEDRVMSIDLESRKLGRGWDVPMHPQWLTRLPDGDVLAASQRGEFLHRLPADAAAIPIQLPVLHRENGSRYTMRVTGAPAVDADDGLLWIPSLFIDTVTPIGGNVQADVEVLPPGYYVDERTVLVIPDTPRFMAALIQAPLDPVDLQDAPAHIFASNFGAAPIRGVQSAVLADPGSDIVFVAIEGAEAVLATRPTAETHLPPAGPFTQHYAAAARAPDGPRALWHRGGQLWAYGFLDRVVSRYTLSNVRERVMTAHVEVQTLTPEARLRVSPTMLGHSVDEGRSLFFSSINPRMVLPGGGLACATCHIDGGTDGLTWPLEDGPRQTPSLVGVKSEQVPVTWTRSVPTVADEVLLTSVNRMGGRAPGRAAAEDTAFFLDSVPVPDVRPLRADTAAIERGRILFEGSAACIACHSGEHLTDRRPYAMLGEDDVRTPTLRGIAATAPYFHDGSAQTLMDVVERAEDEGMGLTNHLSPAEKRDLVTYLESL